MAVDQSSPGLSRSCGSEEAQGPTRCWGQHRAAGELIVVSFLSLFLELSLIRFINSTVQIVAYFNNFLIISAFLGLGVGSCLVPRNRNLFSYFPIVFCCVLALMVMLDGYGITIDSQYSEEHVIWAMTHATHNLSAIPAIVLVFLANFVFFVPLGYKLGLCLQQFDNRLLGYGYDLAGSFLGVVGFALACYWETPPWVWFAVGGLLVVGLTESPWRRRATVLGFVLVGSILSLLPERGIWSPYYKIRTIPYVLEVGDDPSQFPNLGYGIRVDKLRIQDALRFDENLEKTDLKQWIGYYRLPYQLVKPRDVLILGGGAGNDAAIGLEYGPERIDVVEIDPVLIQLGHDLHPHRPYRDPRVNAINDDARSFLRRSRQTYDLIVMNALDSHHQLPGLSTLRLESYIYTVEAFKDIKRSMHSNSFFVLHLSTSRQWIGERIYWTLTEAFGTRPRLFSTEDSPFYSVAFVFGPQTTAPLDPSVLTVDPDALIAARTKTELATDDWPHLYLAGKRLPALYLQVLGVIVVLTVVVLGKSVARIGRASYLHFFLLGVGFMLLETRSITKAALIFGSTWSVNAIVIGSILLVVFLGNLLLLRKLKPPKSICYLALVASLLASYLVSVDFILGYAFWVRVAMTAVWIGLPIFFAALIFSDSFRGVGNPSLAFGANLLGVVVGGVLEYGSMVYGLNSLYLIAVLIYLLASLLDPGLRLPAFRSGRQPWPSLP